MTRPALSLIALAILIVSPSIGAAQAPATLPSWTLLDQTTPEPIVPGVAYIKKSITSSTASKNSAKTLHLITFDNRTATLKLIDQGNNPKDPNYKNLAAAMQENFCIAGCNGGFFMKDFSPGGLTIIDGKHIGTFATSGNYSGAVAARTDGSLSLLWQEEVDISPDIRNFVQAGPRLVLEGKPKTVYDWSQHRNRTFILTDGGSQWAIGLCTSISLPDLAIALANPAVISELKVWRALNLDGGTSSSFYFNRGAGKAPFYFSGAKIAVRNFLGIIPR
jgi:uncharacterized protein YigE (DUF2233 family)